MSLLLSSGRQTTSLHLCRGRRRSGTRHKGVGIRKWGGEGGEGKVVGWIFNLAKISSVVERSTYGCVLPWGILWIEIAFSITMMGSNSSTCGYSWIRVTFGWIDFYFMQFCDIYEVWVICKLILEVGIFKNALNICIYIYIIRGIISEAKINKLS